MGDDIGFLNKEIRSLDKRIRNLENELWDKHGKIVSLEKELKFKDEMIAAINIHGPDLEQEIKELKEQLRKRGQ